MNGEEPEPSTSQTSSSCCPLRGWSASEKYDLLQGLKAVGSHDFEHVQKFVPTKSQSEIETAIAHYKSVAFSDHNRNTQESGKTHHHRQLLRSESIKPSIPLSHWAKLLTDSVSFDGLQTEIATALRLIAEFEEIPPVVYTENIDFKNAYHLLANAVEGKALQEDKYLTPLIAKCIVETALTSKAFIRGTTLQQIIESVGVSSEKDVKKFPNPVLNTELATILHLATQRNYNPLGISEDHLKPSSP